MPHKSIKLLHIYFIFLQVYQNNNPSISLKIFFLVYGGSVEEQGYLTALRREKEAFDKLINTKTVLKFFFIGKKKIILFALVIYFCGIF